MVVFNCWKFEAKVTSSFSINLNYVMNNTLKNSNTWVTVPIINWSLVVIDLFHLNWSDFQLQSNQFHCTWNFKISQKMALLFFSSDDRPYEFIIQALPLLARMASLQDVFWRHVFRNFTFSLCYSLKVSKFYCIINCFHL